MFTLAPYRSQKHIEWFRFCADTPLAEHRIRVNISQPKFYRTNPLHLYLGFAELACVQAYSYNQFPLQNMGNAMCTEKQEPAEEYLGESCVLSAHECSEASSPVMNPFKIKHESPLLLSRCSFQFTGDVFDGEMTLLATANDTAVSQAI
ncbi:Hypothetical_protein [Hexamita inflata]|uniref:Hypothetical_protein n=1 Tax=Hexamita inflata TaxID=28002 RepID=A0AA86QE02_9EUKA|nr:Hypothetical protein HINF_LOCUS40838 [Hexamita inflata]CAI9959738.1 Hypothetical protein HINF_LOCUS47383 [Hexamita inflata]